MICSLAVRRWNMNSASSGLLYAEGKSEQKKNDLLSYSL